MAKPSKPAKRRPGVKRGTTRGRAKAPARARTPPAKRTPPRKAAARVRAALWPVTVLSVTDTQSGDPDTSPGAFEARILAEGDSWFTIGAIPSSNLLFELRFPRRTAVVNIAYPGDTIVRIADIAANPDLREMLTDRNSGWRWHAIVLSGGGNDLIDRARECLRAPPGGSGSAPADYVDAAALGRVIAEVKKGYRDIAALRDSTSLNAGVTIVAHTYDYATPRNAPAKFLFAGFKGPWLHRAFTDAGVPEPLRVAIADRLFDALADGITALEREIAHFRVVRTRKSLVRAALGETGASGDWLNEIHPTSAGYAKLAAKLEPVIDAVVAAALP
ncbi:MAG: SGNH/GDSL hydrolase family protein [Burkholderiales bacterium]|nr:SGNH/GDSL hydrolase family protein [Burkholderiales bacterium]